MTERPGLRRPTRVALTPAKTGVQVRKMLGPRFRGNDVREEGKAWN